jgi:hypothetical protein
MNQNSDDFPTLIAQTGPLNGERWVLSETTVIGRETDCEIIIPSRQVSRFHARLTTTSDGTLLEDLGSKNGTHCNGQVVIEPILLQDGDVIQIAFAQQFVFISSDATLPLDAIPVIETESERSGITRLRLDKRSRRVWVLDTEVIPPLSVSQFQLLELLYEHNGRVVSRNMLIEAVWGEEEALGISEQALDALIRRLRDRLAVIDSAFNYIITVRGHGLRLDNPSIQ